MARGEVTGKKPRVTLTRAKRSGSPQWKPDKTASTVDSEVTGSDQAEQRAEPEIEAAPHAEPCANETVAKPRIRGPPIPPAAYTIATFCAAHDLSESFYFKLCNQGLAPREMKVGARVL